MGTGQYRIYSNLRNVHVISFIQFFPYTVTGQNKILE